MSRQTLARIGTALLILTVAGLVIGIVLTDIAIDDTSVEMASLGGTSAPASPGAPTPVPPTPEPVGTPDPAAIGRDATRRGHLEQLAAALEEYFGRFGDYPDTAGNLQTLCAFTEVDAGCQLEEVMAELPVDPLGDPLRNGYWYASDGSTFTLYAIQEAPDPEVPRCPQVPNDLLNRGFIYCIQGSR